MSDYTYGNIHCCPDDLNEALSIHARKITDSCRDKDCIEDLRVYLTRGSQSLLESATGAKVRCADLLYTYIDVEPVAFDKNHYCIDVTFYYRIFADATIGAARPAALYGLAAFTKRAVLCGEESKAHIFTSDTKLCAPDGYTRYSANFPTAVVEVLDPMVLSSKIRDICDIHCSDATVAQIPGEICKFFDDELVLSGDKRRLFVTLGQFSIIRLERDAQLIVPVLDYSIPTKECCDTDTCCAEDPCEIFSKIPFPVAQFAPRNCDRQNDCSSNNNCDGYTTTGSN